MTIKKQPKAKLSNSEAKRSWKENNAHLNQQVALYLPKTAYNEWMKASEKSGVSMAGLMLASIGFLNSTDGPTLLELAVQAAENHGHRVQFVDPDSDQIKRVRTGRYNKERRNG